MRCTLAAITGTLVVILACYGSAAGGAKEGKIRWMNNKDTAGRSTVKAPIKVPAHSAVELKIIFKANELAEFFVIGDGDTDLDLFVYDADGKLVASDEDPSDRASDLCVCRWTPKNEQEYKIVIKNLDKKLYNTAQCGCN
jgi:hypothetical protein